jgi:hypothetical protein
LELNFLVDLFDNLGHGVVSRGANRRLVTKRILVHRFVGDVLHCSKLLLAQFFRGAARREAGLEGTFFVAAGILNDDRCVRRSSLLGRGRGFLEGRTTESNATARRRDNHLIEAVECVLGGGRLGRTNESS